MATLSATAQTLWAHDEQVPSVPNSALACGRYGPLFLERVTDTLWPPYPTEGLQ